MDFLKDFGAVSAGLSVGVTFFALGWKADGLISKQASNDLSNYLQNINLKKSTKAVHLWPKVFMEFFDRVFGEMPFSFKRIIRSVVATFVASSICFLIVVILFEESIQEVAGGFHVVDSAIVYSRFLLFASIANTIPDYLSLIETRIVMEKIGKTNKPFIQCLWIIFDLVATFVVFSVSFFIVLFLTGKISDFAPDLGIFDITIQYFEAVFNPMARIENAVMSTFLWTTFSTSVWLWLYVISQIVTRLVVPFRKSVRFLQYLLPIDTKPLQSVCTVMAVISCLITWVILAPLELL